MPVTSHRSQSGFTLIEVLVTIVILMVGILGVVAMVDGANAITTKTKAREGANNVARSVVEVGRSVQYKNLSAARALRRAPGTPGAGRLVRPAGPQIESRGFLYDVSLQVCSMDDPKDNLGAHDGTIEFCPDSDVGTGAGATADRNPDDYKRIAITLTWKRENGTEKVKQTSLISNPVGGLGPTVIRLDAPAVGGTPKTVMTPGVVNFEADTSTDAADLNWSVEGVSQGPADPVGASKRRFTFTWDIEGGSGNYYNDCTYVVQAEASDDKGRTGTPKALTIVLNRAVPKKVEAVDAGRNSVAGTAVDIRWQKNVECDVLGYRVYRSVNGAAGPWAQVPCPGQVGTYVIPQANGELGCLDESAPLAPAVLHYKVVGVDTAPGARCEREASTPLRDGIGEPGAHHPGERLGLPGRLAGCTEPDGSPASDGATVVRWDPASDPDGSIDFYRIYRDGNTYADRYGIFFPSGTDALAWTDPETPDGPHTYRVTAVDDELGESALSAAVADFP